MPSGGKRAGAGRKAMSVDEKRVQVSVSISQDTRDHLAEIVKRENTKIGRVLDRLVEQEYNKEK